MRDIAIAGWVLVAVLATGILLLLAAAPWHSAPQEQQQEDGPQPDPVPWYLAAPPAPAIPEAVSEDTRVMSPFPAAWEPPGRVTTAGAPPWEPGGAS